MLSYSNSMIFSRRYAIDATKLENELGWKADENFNSSVIKTMEQYLKKYNMGNK